MASDLMRCLRKFVHGINEGKVNKGIKGRSRHSRFTFKNILYNHYQIYEVKLFNLFQGELQLLYLIFLNINKKYILYE